MMRSNFFYLSADERTVCQYDGVNLPRRGLSPWRTHVARIAQGFGVFAVVCVLLETANNYFGLAFKARAFYDALSAFAPISLIYGVPGLLDRHPVAAGAGAARELPDAMLMQIYSLQRRVEEDPAVRIRSWWGIERPFTFSLGAGLLLVALVAVSIRHYLRGRRSTGATLGGAAESG